MFVGGTIMMLILSNNNRTFQRCLSPKIVHLFGNNYFYTVPCLFPLFSSYFLMACWIGLVKFASVAKPPQALPCSPPNLRAQWVSFGSTIDEFFCYHYSCRLFVVILFLSSGDMLCCPNIASYFLGYLYSNIGRACLWAQHRKLSICVIVEVTHDLLRNKYNLAVRFEVLCDHNLM